MDYNAIIRAIVEYGGAFMAIMLFLVTATTMIVEVVKRLLPRIPTDLVVFIVAITLTVLALYVAAAVMDIAVPWYCVVGAVTMGFAVAYAAMFGWEKFTALWSRLKDHMKNK